MVIDALTSPMNSGDIEKIRDLVRDGDALDLVYEVKLSTEFVKKISGSLFRRVEGLDLSVQDLVSAPRTLKNFKGLNEKAINDLRHQLRVPLTRLYLNDQVSEFIYLLADQFYRFDEMVLSLSSIFNSNPDLGKKILEIL